MRSPLRAKALLLACACVFFAGCPDEPAAADATCTDGRRNGVETDVDCGGSCAAKCGDGGACSAAADCASGVCLDRVCAAPSCTDRVPNGDETGLDCGGHCGATCGGGSPCVQDADCLSGSCVDRVCIAPCDADLQNDPEHCGRCEIACTDPPHAPAACRRGECTRGPCEDGWFDFEPAAPGCETRCEGTTCTRPDGSTVVLTAPPIPETGATAAAFASGSSLGGEIQTNKAFTNLGVLGDSTPPASPDAPVMKNDFYRNHGGLVARPK